MERDKTTLSINLRKVGNMVFYQRNGKIISRSATNSKYTDRKTDEQLRQRFWHRSVQMLWSDFKPFLVRYFEVRDAAHSAYLAFMHHNNKRGVFLGRKNMDKIALPLQISCGSLRSIEQQLDDDGRIITNLDLGDLVVGEETTVGQLSQQIVRGTDFGQGDTLQWFVVHQQKNGNIYDIQPEVVSLTLDCRSWVRLADAYPAGIFGQKDHYLATAPLTEACCACFVHLRETDEGELQVSTQSLLNHNTDVIEHFDSDEQFESARQTYLTPYERKKDKANRR